MKILTYPNKRLTKPTEPWDFEKDGIPDIEMRLLSDALVGSRDGLALAANQIGISRRMFVLKESLAHQCDMSTLVVNPTFTQFGSSDVEMEEGCLSFPGVYLRIKRMEMIRCSYVDVDGNRRDAVLEGLAARVFQHECEHLDGRLFIDNVNRIKKFQIIGEMRKRR